MTGDLSAARVALVLALASNEDVFGVPHGVLSSRDEWHIPVVVVLLFVGAALALRRRE